MATLIRTLCVDAPLVIGLSKENEADVRAVEGGELVVAFLKDGERYDDACVAADDLSKEILEEIEGGHGCTATFTAQAENEPLKVSAVRVEEPSKPEDVKPAA